MYKAVSSEYSIMEDNLKYIIESLLFVSESPVTIDKLKLMIGIPDTKKIRSAIEDLMEEYALRKGGFLLQQVAGGYQFRTRAKYNPWIKKFIQPSPPRLSRAALETLAIIAYNQPVIRSDIDTIRGVDSGSVIKVLMEKKLVRVLGRKKIPGRPLIYGTTRHFLEVFGLKNLKDLPTVKEIEELGFSANREGQGGNPKNNKKQSHYQRQIKSIIEDQTSPDHGQE